MNKLSSEVTVVFVPVGMSEDALDVLVSDLPYPVHQTVCEDSVTGDEWLILSKESTPEEYVWVGDWLDSWCNVHDVCNAGMCTYLGDVEPDYECLKYVSVDQ